MQHTRRYVYLRQLYISGCLCLNIKEFELVYLLDLLSTCNLYTDELSEFR